MRSISLPPDDNPDAPAFDVPDGACDAHAHLFGPYDRYPLRHTQSFVPPLATAEMHRAMATRLRLQRAVFVQSSAYGTDHACLRNALRRSDGWARGVALLGDDLNEHDLQELIATGFVAARFNCVAGDATISRLSSWLPRVRELGWHVELLVNLDTLHRWGPSFLKWGLPLVIDHMGYTRAEQALQHPGLATLQALLRDGTVWSKLSGVDRIGNRGSDYRDAQELMGMLVEANENRLVWGTDWPHISRSVVPNDGALLNRLAAWVDDEKVLKKILVDNPIALYRFHSF